MMGGHEIPPCPLCLLVTVNEINGLIEAVNLHSRCHDDTLKALELFEQTGRELLADKKALIQSHADQMARAGQLAGKVAELEEKISTMERDAKYGAK